jgi:hypothetical protein
MFSTLKRRLGEMENTMAQERGRHRMKGERSLP